VIDEGQGRPPAPGFDVEVVWGDIAMAEGDVTAVGHYEGTLPGQAELAVDRAISGVGDGSGAERPLVLTEHARRGLLRGELGDIDFFPWLTEPGAPARVVTVVGMGHVGSFGSSELRKMARNLVWATANLPGARTLCTVLIGSGANNLTVSEAVDGFVRGLAEAVTTGSRGSLERVRMVEWRFDRAQLILEALDRVSRLEPVSGAVDLRCAKEVTTGKGGGVAPEHGLALVLAAAALTVGPAGAEGLANILASVPSEDGLREQAESTLKGLLKLDGAGASDPLAMARNISVKLQPAAVAATQPTRVCFVVDGATVRAAAVTDTATVAERVLGTDLELIKQAVARMSVPHAGDLRSLARFLGQLLIPRDFRRLLGGERPMVFEVDRTMATVHWELLPVEAEPGSDGEPLGLHCHLARQLRTTYSPPPSPEWRSDHPLRALVIGDPGDPAQGNALEGARKEALEVKGLLLELGVDVTALVGAPPPPGQRSTLPVPPASRLEVLRLLIEGGFDLVHYTGHGTFDPADPAGRAGWLFADGLLTARELETMERPPQLVVANACSSGRLAGTAAGQGASEVGLLPSLADEFLRRGVRNYVGTAWEVSDPGAVAFARTFYGKLLAKPPAGEKVADLGSAMFEARRVLHEDEAEGDALWAAYQHYGDPTLQLVDAEARPSPTG
jgi:hypothetical protein